MDVFQIIFGIIIVVTMGGWCCDWVFSGMTDPIIDNGFSEVSEKSLKPESVESPEWTESQRIEQATDTKDENVIIACPNCGEETSYSSHVVSIYGKVRCKECGQIFREQL